MIHELTGDLLLSRADAIALGVAPGDDFRHGLALAVREAWPALYKDFRHYCRQQHPRPGTLWLWQGVGAGGRRMRFCALFTHDAASREGGHAGAARTEHVNRALHELAKLARAERFASVALPRLATGGGGIAWHHVLPLIHAQLGALSIPVLVYAEHQHGVAASEPLTQNG